MVKTPSDSKSPHATENYKEKKKQKQTMQQA